MDRINKYWEKIHYRYKNRYRNRFGARVKIGNYYMYCLVCGESGFYMHICSRCSVCGGVLDKRRVSHAKRRWFEPLR